MRKNLVWAGGHLHSGQQNDSGIEQLSNALKEINDRFVLLATKPVVALSAKRFESEAAIESAAIEQLPVSSGDC
jgi:hypothetical protein